MPRPRQTATDHLNLSYRDLLRASSRFITGKGESISLGKIPQRRVNGERSRFMAFRRLLQQAGKQGNYLASAYLDILVHVNVTRGDAVELRFDRGAEEPYVELMWEFDPMFLALVEAGAETMPSFGITEQLENPSLVAINFHAAVYEYFMRSIFAPERREQGISERILFRSTMERFDNIPNNAPLLEKVFAEIQAHDPPWIEFRERKDELDQTTRTVVGTDVGYIQFIREFVHGHLHS